MSWPRLIHCWMVRSVASQKKGLVMLAVYLLRLKVMVPVWVTSVPELTHACPARGVSDGVVVDVETGGGELSAGTAASCVLDADDSAVVAGDGVVVHLDVG